MESRVSIGKAEHKGQQLDCYIPEIYLGGYWKSILSSGSYILKETFDPVILCKKCYGEGCGDCKNRGFKKGESEDQLKLAQGLLDYKIKEIHKAEKLLSCLCD